MRVTGISVLLIAASCAFEASAASMNYERLEGLFLQGQYGAVVNEADAVARSGYGRKDEVYYLKGLGQLKTKQFAGARDSFSYIVSNTPYSKRLFDARLGIGDAYMLEGNLNAAAGVYNRMAGEFPSGKNLSEVYGRLAACYGGLGLRDKAAAYESMARRGAPNGFGAGVGVTNIQNVPAGPQVNAAGRYDSLAAGLRGTAGSGGVFHSVQAGSFKSRGNASKFAKELSSRGYPSRVEIPAGSAGQLYRVKVGRFASRSDAEAMASRLQGDGYMTAICDDGT